MDDRNPPGGDSEEASKEDEGKAEGKQDERVVEEAEDEEEAFGGESVEFEGAPESERTLLSDFCKGEEFSGEEQQGEGEWVCEEVEERGEYYEEGLFAPEEYEGETEKEITIEEKRSLDSEYLKAVLGTPLTFALMDIAMRRPTDPIQYLGHYLLRWRWGGDNKEKYEKSMKELTEERTAYLERIKEKERQEMLMKEQLLEEERRAERVESSLEDDMGESHLMVEN